MLTTVMKKQIPYLITLQTAEIETLKRKKNNKIFSCSAYVLQFSALTPLTFDIQFY